MTADHPARHPSPVEQWNETWYNYSATSRIMDLIDSAAVKYTADPAVRTTSGVALTHGELAAESSLLAERLTAYGVLPRTPVGLLVDHVPEAVVGIHAILRADAYYVPLDPRWPARRIAKVLKASYITHVLVTEPYCGRANDIGDDMTIIAVRHGSEPEVLSRSAPRPSVRQHESGPAGPDELAYTIFTSGSTGRPKAVAVRHTSVVNLIEWFNRRNSVAPSDILLQVASFSFDLSVYDVFGTLSAGASVLLLPDADLEELEEIAIALVEHGVTLWNSAPAVFTAVTLLLDESSRQQRDRLRRVFLSGDWIPLNTLEVLRREFPRATLVALGGATEACVWSNDFVVDEVDPSWRSIPYGHPMQNSRYYVLHEDLTPCGIDEPGELYIAGACVAAGYLGDPALTADRFLPDPWDQGDGCKMYRTGDRARWTSNGWVEFLGRMDSQVKIHGFRIELGEIEQVAMQVLDVDEAVALKLDEGGSPYLALALRASGELDVKMVTEKLGEWLPRYMEPRRVVVCQAFPVGQTGKVDRAALQYLFQPAK
ncbi:amino acid adenylation domain-containing protein [Streptomyces sp. NPDC045470]|uniref:amino acid adenylation domain-containing protein n=1 Tax=Streptomyces sp. NPDC045470 TaxID=3155469 RepID=UPI0033D6A631